MEINLKAFREDRRIYEKGRKQLNDKMIIKNKQTMKTKTQNTTEENFHKLLDILNKQIITSEELKKQIEELKKENKKLKKQKQNNKPF